MRNYIGAVLLVIMVIVYYFSMDKMVKQSATQRQTIDSLQDEILLLNIDNGRYEIILDNIWNIDSNLVINSAKNIE